MITATMEEKIETLKAAARGYMMMAMAMDKAGYSESRDMYFRSEISCTVMALELEEELEDLNNYMMAA